MDNDCDSASDIASDDESNNDDELQTIQSDVESVHSGSNLEVVENITFISKDKSILWSSNAPNTASENIITGRPGITKFAAVRIHSILSSFELTFTRTLKAIVIENTNKYGQKNVPHWRDIDFTTFDAFIGLLILAGG